MSTLDVHPRGLFYNNSFSVVSLEALDESDAQYIFGYSLNLVLPPTYYNSNKITTKNVEITKAKITRL